MEGGFRKYHVPHKKKASRETHAERDDESGYMGFKNEKAKVQVLLVEDEIIADKKNENIQESIGAAACRIAKSLNRHEFSKRRIEKINK
jgi:ribosome-associated translation inhibitor RaiA